MYTVLVCITPRHWNFYAIRWNMWLQHK